MEYTILKSFDRVSLYIDQVSNIADNNKGAFGFLASSAYDQMASKGQLWVIVNEAGELKGYLMFGGTMPSIKVFQIYSCRSVRGHRIGSCGSLAFEFSRKGTALFGHLTPRSGERSRLNRCPVSVAHYTWTDGKPI